jgi:hypothetical protein
MSNLEIVAKVRDRIEAIMRQRGKGCDRSCHSRADGLRVQSQRLDEGWRTKNALDNRPLRC